MKMTVYFDGSQGDIVSINIDGEDKKGKWQECLVCLDFSPEDARALAALLVAKAEAAEKWQKRNRHYVTVESCG